MQYLLTNALLIVDRGSREPEVREELEEICFLAKKRGRHTYVNYSFLEVLPPYIPEGISRCAEAGATYITVMPYFLYPGMKLKDTVKQSAKIRKDRNLELVITRPLSYHPTMRHLIIDRINGLKKLQNISQPDKQCDVILIGHGSSDKNAHDAFVHTANAIEHYYRKVQFCFLELDQPNIEEGVREVIAQNPNVILVVPYFLHKGAHIKRDVVNDINAALEKFRFKNAFISPHLGVDEKLVDIVIERASEVENRYGIWRQRPGQKPTK